MGGRSGIPALYDGSAECGGTARDRQHRIRRARIRQGPERAPYRRAIRFSSSHAGSGARESIEWRTKLTRIAILVGSTRPGRNGEAVARWVYDRAVQREDATFEVVDIAKQDLPFLDEPAPAALDSDYRMEHTRRWSETIASFDGYVFVTPEYNHSLCGALKNAIDFLYVEWHNKAAGFVGYGLNGGVRAV